MFSLHTNRLLFRLCEDKESVSYYRKHGALTALPVNYSTFSPPSWQREAITLLHSKPNWEHNDDVPGEKLLFFSLKYERDGSSWKYGELMEELRERGGEVLTPFMLFLQRSPLISPGLQGGAEGEGDRIRPTPATSDRSRTVKPQETRTLVLLLSRCIAGPSSDPGQDWIQTSPSNSLSPVCLLFGTDRWADIQAPQAAPKEGSLDLQTLNILGRGILASQEE